MRCAAPRVIVAGLAVFAAAFAGCGDKGQTAHTPAESKATSTTSAVSPTAKKSIHVDLTTIALDRIPAAC
jgi:hypothetical protein